MGTRLTTPLGLPGNLRDDLARLWDFVREVSGDDAYERYLARHVQTHPELPPLSRQEFFAAEQDRKWDGITRCC
ncbi:MAG: YbdD/YjiX family protein [Betaproteobacteria bacterium]